MCDLRSFEVENLWGCNAIYWKNIISTRDWNQLNEQFTFKPLSFPPTLHPGCVRGKSGGIQAKCGLAVCGFWLASSSHVLGLSPVGCEMPKRVTATYNVESLVREFTVQETTPSMGPLRLLGSYELFIASQISSPICLSACENASLWCTCYISLLLNKIKSQHTLATGLFICVSFWWGASPTKSTQMFWT